MTAALIEAARAALEAWDSLPRKTYSLSMSVSEWLEYRMAPAIARLRTALAAAEQPAEPVSVEIARLRAALKWYADGEHFTKAQPDAWDTVSGELQNWWCDEAGTAMFEDGTLAGMVLAGKLTGEQLNALEDGEVVASPAAPAQPLTDEQLLAIAREHAGGTSIKLTRDVGPYEVTEPTYVYRSIARAIERAHGIGGKQ